MSLSVLSQLLLSDFPVIRIETCWAFSNLITEGGKLLALCIQNQVFANIIKRMMNCDDAFATEGLICIKNAALVGTPSILHHLIQPGFLETICEKLDCSNQVQKAEVVFVALEAIEALLFLGKPTSGTGQNEAVNYIVNNNLAQKLESAQSHPEPAIYEKTMGILNTFFQCEHSN